MEPAASYRAMPEGGFAARVEEMPGVMTQGGTLEKARADLADAVQPTIGAARAESAKLLAGAAVVRERITIDVPDSDLRPAQVP